MTKTMQKSIKINSVSKIYLCPCPSILEIKGSRTARIAGSGYLCSTGSRKETNPDQIRLWRLQSKGLWQG